jgi:hypothetical protein
MRIVRREKVFGPGRAVPLDRNAKARIAAYARAWDRRHRQPGGGGERREREGRHPRPRRPGRPGRPAVGVPQRPLGLLLPELRDDRRKGRLCPQHGG